jgi:replicative DNA helicase
MSERLLPHSIEAEQGVLGSILIDPEALVWVVESLRAEDFYREAHRQLYEVMCSLYEQGQPADFITVCDALERCNRLDAVGGPGYITSLVNQVPTSGNLLHYARIVREKALYRRLIHAAGRMVAAAYEEHSDALEAAEQMIFALGQQQQPGDVFCIQHTISECMQDIDTLHERRGTTAVMGLSTGFHHLDVPLGGLHASDLIIVAARPGTGKTSFALALAAHAAYQQGRRVAFFSLEMGRKQLGLRLLAMQSRIDQHRLRMGWVHEEEWERLLEAAAMLSGGAFWLDETAGLELSALRRKARRLQAQQGIDLVIVDYLQLMHATLEGKRYPNREQEIAEISRGLKGLAKELQVPVVALAQLSRAVETRQSKIPQLSDLRESGAIENDADVVLLLYRDELYNPESEARGTADVMIAKHRNGPVGTIRLGFDATQTRFYELPATPEEEG